VEGLRAALEAFYRNKYLAGGEGDSKPASPTGDKASTADVDWTSYTPETETSDHTHEEVV
jgi:hypothetical protein